MRDPDRIPEVLAAIEQAWTLKPDLRLGEVLNLACLMVGEQSAIGRGRITSMSDGPRERALFVVPCSRRALLEPLEVANYILRVLREDRLTDRPE